MRPLWVLRTGLFLYDHLSLANQLPRSKLIRRKQQPIYFDPLDAHLNKGFIFYDCATDDARLTLVNAMQAKKHGATIMPQTKLIQADVVDGQWRLTLKGKTANPFQIKAKALINTTGPWVISVNKLLHIPIKHTISLVKGSHLVVQKLYDGEHAYMLQHEDKRIVFAIPYHGYTMVGTTDVAFSGDPDDLHIETNEINYLCSIINRFFNKQIQEKDIITTWSGIRPLLSDARKTPSALSRDYIYHYSNQPAPAVTVYGGKITTYRQLAQQAVNTLREIFPNLAHSRTATTPLPGAIMGTMDFTNYLDYAYQKYHWLDKKIQARLLKTYGTCTENVLVGCHKMADLGKRFTETLYQVEVDYLLKEEWASNCDDVLWRRTKIGLTINEVEKNTLANYMLNRYQYHTQ